MVADLVQLIALQKPVDDPYVRTRVHLQALLRIIGHRGPDQFVSELGRRLFLDTFALFVSASPDYMLTLRHLTHLCSDDG